MISACAIWSAVVDLVKHWRRRLCDQTYTCTICRRVRLQGNMPRQYLCTTCHSRLQRLGLHGDRNWKNPAHKTKWAEVSDEDTFQLRITECTCEFSKDKYLDGGCGYERDCYMCEATGVTLDRKSPLELLAEAADADCQ